MSAGHVEKECKNALEWCLDVEDILQIILLADVRWISRNVRMREYDTPRDYQSLLANTCDSAARDSHRGSLTSVS
ncbi:hypothetical protein J6590_013001 [Homalodisca vitripennis]|nr:hypothetical protein J6590_013001 [Homalodisca vitripennis]